ncbi:putative S-adenosylmethionine-dependent methyltransferase [Actinomadura rubteroloni]|uniref:Putative S-adenosylmethionine-dependent methyltransferase n=1 Tax=Actinomadura rubteroloni TaxID=1926885 RepID=A0A2P4URH0_9ACTN|nr:class I SAM-dependent methyltransferase [Actinomadura rubteroloni]POM27649.1 putative S-adenosylmethionine-dependent methyltransferase [Actinomadura rubteroloni]
MSPDSVRAAYDAIAVPYAEMFRTVLEDRPADRASLALFAELAGGGPVADVGSGPGRVTAYLRGLGCDVTGIDLSPEMVALARRTFPDVPFRQGAMAGLDLPDGALGGLLAWYSVIHIEPDAVPSVFAEFHRVMAPGGHLMLGFQVGDEPLRLVEPFGRPVSLDFHRLDPDRVAAQLEAAGFAVRVRTIRAPEGRENVPQAHLLARRMNRPADG